LQKRSRCSACEASAAIGENSRRKIDALWLKFDVKPDVGVRHPFRAQCRQRSKVLRKYNIAQATIEPHHDSRIQRLKKSWIATCKEQNYCMLYVVFLINRTALESLNLRIPHEFQGRRPTI
jgi:hypothetical protein